MQVKSNVAKILPDNDQWYIDFVTVSVAHSDPESQMEMTKTPDGLSVHITPSTPSFKQDIIDNLLETHRMFKLKIVFSSSLKISRLISYTIKFQ